MKIKVENGKKNVVFTYFPLNSEDKFIWEILQDLTVLLSLLLELQ